MSLRTCGLCGAPVIRARYVDNHMVMMNREPDPCGDARMLGPLDDEPCAMFGLPTTTLAGHPLSDLTTYSKHECPEG